MGCGTMLNKIRIGNKEYLTKDIQKNVLDDRIKGEIVDLEIQSEKEQYSELTTIEEKIDFIAKKLNLVEELTESTK